MSLIVPGTFTFLPSGLRPGHSSPDRCESSWGLSLDHVRDTTISWVPTVFAMVSAVSAVSATSAVFRLAVLMERATARMIERKAFTVLKYSLLPARVNLPGGDANCNFQLHKRSQLFIRVHNETLPVISRNSGYRHMSRRVEKHGIAVLPGWLPYSRSQIPWIPRN